MPTILIPKQQVSNIGATWKTWKHERRNRKKKKKKFYKISKAGVSELLYQHGTQKKLYGHTLLEHAVKLKLWCLLIYSNPALQYVYFLAMVI